MTDRSPLDESTWIERFILPRTVPSTEDGSWLGPGDDAALLPIPAGCVSVLTVDGLVEGKHFLPDWLGDDELAARLVAVTVSDLAAMGATPLGILLSFETPTLPGRLGETFFRGLDRGMLRAGRLIGGNVVATDGVLALSATAVGAVDPSRALRRDRVRPGDTIAVSGLPGRAGEVRERIARGEPLTSVQRAPWVSPADRVPLGRALAAEGVAAAIDLSDGLLRDLRAMLRASGCRAHLGIDSYARALSAEGISLETGFGGGEDYELCVAGERASIERAFASVGAEPLFLGTATESKPENVGEIEIAIGGSAVEITAPGWDPFRRR